MKKREFIAEIGALPVSELVSRARQLAEEQLKLRFRRAASGQLDQPHHLRDVRRKIARIKTLISQRRQQGVGGADVGAEG